MKNHILFLLLFFSFSVLYSQNYIEGYIITTDNDTVHGLIDFAPDKFNYERCRFKSNEYTEESIFYPVNIKAYRFEVGKYYISKEINLNGEIRHVFLEYLLQGIVDLYSYTDNEFTYFIFEKEDGTMQYVTQNPEKIEDNKIIPDLSYRNKVRRALGDCYPAVYDAAKLKFTPKDMIHITKVYHDNMCDTGEECIIFENEEIGKTYFQTKYSIYLGMQQFKYKFGIITDHFTSTYSPTIGFQMNFIFPRWTHAFSVQTDFSFSKIKDVNRRYMGISKGNPKHIVADYKMYSFTGKIGGKYVFQTSGIRPVIEAGAVVSFLIDPYCIIKEETFYSDTNSSHINSGIKYEMQKIFPGAYAGIGFDYLIGKEHSLFFRIVFDRYLKIDINDNDDMNMMHMKLGYNF